MYNILIADDETYVRDKIKNIVEEMGLFVPFVAEDGDETLAIIRDNPIHAILLDINMPGPSGLEVLEEIRKMGLDTHVVIISGYSEFEYARDAIRYDAMDYISKPVAPQEIKALLQNLHARIRRKEEEKNEYEYLLQQVEQSRDSIRARLLNEVADGRLSRDAILERAGFLKIDVSGRFYIAGLVEIEKGEFSGTLLRSVETEQDYQVLVKSAENRISEFFKFRNNCFVFQKESGLFAVIAETEDEAGFSDMLKGIKAMLAESGICVCAAMGKKTEGIENVWTSFEQAKKALQYKLLLGSDYILSIRDLAGSEEASLLEIDMEKIQLALKLGQIEEVNDCIHNTFEIIRKDRGSFSPQHVYLAVTKYILCLIEVLQEYNMDSSELYSLCNRPSEQGTIENLEKWLKALFREYFAKIEQAQNEVMNAAIGGVKKYVREHYKENITLNSISEALNYSQNYLGHYFKVNTGYTVSEYINRVRVGAAKELLKNTGLKVYEIAYEVGFNDQNYFCTIFKKVTGLTPKEFRDL